MYERRIAHLEEAHHVLDKQIAEMERKGNFKDEQLTELKKRKLFLKDEIARLKKKQWEHDHETIDIDDERQYTASMTTNTFTLNRKQAAKLAKMVSHFKEVEWFTLEETHTSGIGATVTVKFNLFGDYDKDNDTTVDITDVETW